MEFPTSSLDDQREPQEVWEWSEILDLVDYPVYLVAKVRKVSQLKPHFPAAKDKRVNLVLTVFAARLDSPAQLD